jgi:hypothetical protein
LSDANGIPENETKWRVILKCTSPEAVFLVECDPSMNEL